MATTEQNTETTKQEEGTPLIFLPEGFLMLMWAVILDILGLVDFIPVIGNALSIGVSILGLLTIGLWTYMKTGTAMVTNRAAKTLKMLKKPIFVAIFGMIPFAAVVPLWTIIMFMDLSKIKSGDTIKVVEE